MHELVSLILNLGVPLLIICVAMVTGSILERRHYRSIDQREGATSRLPLLNGKRYPTDRPVVDARLVSGSVVISYDHFKRFLAGLRMTFGGEVKSYVSLLDRGRREAVLRMKETCPDADLIVNLRVETSSISKGRRRKGLGAVEIFAYGTALWYGPDAS